MLMVLRWFVRALRDPALEKGMSAGERIQGMAEGLK